MSIKSVLTVLAAVSVLAFSVPAAHGVGSNPVTITGETAGATPFISFVSLHMADTNAFDHAVFTVQPKAGSVTRPVSARYSRNYLLGRGYIHADTGEVIVPVFGLYQHRVNTVMLVTSFVDGNSQQDTMSITTTAFEDPARRHPEVLQARTADTTLSFDFFVLKCFDQPSSPNIVDTDGELRWVGTSGYQSIPSAIYKNGIYVNGPVGPIRMEWDGTVTPLQDYTSIGFKDFHHNFDYGRDGLIGGIDTTTDTESVIVEFDADGNILYRWNMADIISAAMIAGGDDPAGLIPTRTDDWFHNNCAAYRAADNSLVVSSRENFVIAIDYDSGAIKWIFGDPRKNWYQFPSLRKYALTYPDTTHVPIGQHALTFYNDRLLLFDNGYASLHQLPAGKSRTYSAPRKYKIDTAKGTAVETWTYLSDPPLYSPICSSCYEDQPGNYLMDYASVGPFLYSQVRGVNPAGQKVFEYKYSCATPASSGWNSTVVHMENLSFD